ncbi:hypothetical protein LguiB_021007 [Lonicera macranthoides]
MGERIDLGVLRESYWRSADRHSTEARERKVLHFLYLVSTNSGNTFPSEEKNRR